MARKDSNKNYLRAELSPFEQHPMGWSQLLAMLYPNSYEVAMANIGFQWIFGLLQTQHHILTERFFYNDIHSLESGRPLSEFPVIAVSMPYEIDILNFVEMLKSSGIEPLAEYRGGKPLIIGGGDALTINPFPFSAIFDMIILGDGEDWARRFPEIALNFPPGLVANNEFLDVCAKIGGSWLPSRDAGREIHRAYPKRDYPAFTPILTSFGHFRNMFLVEAQCGCPFKCAFCTSSWLDEPFYNFTAENIYAVYDKFGQKASRVGLVGSAIAEHQELELIIRRFAERGTSVHLSSIRLDRVSDEVVRLLAKSGSKTATFAPETASESLAKRIHKWIPPESIIEQAHKLSKLGFDEMKLYWILGLPGESECDVEILSETIFNIANAADMRISCSINPFIPKPHSPFETEKMLSHAGLTRRFNFLKAHLRGIKNLGLEINYSRRSRLSAVLSIGGHELTPAILEMPERGIKGALSRIGIDLDDEIFAPLNPDWSRIT